MLGSNISLWSNLSRYELYFLSYVILINLVTFMVYGIDKRRAKNKGWRIPEHTLILLCIIGGSIGAIIAMVLFHHKISKKKFYISVPVLIILNKFIELTILNYIRA